MDGVEDKGEDQRQEEGSPASLQKVDGVEGNILSPDVHISAMRMSQSQDGQAGEKIFKISLTSTD